MPDSASTKTVFIIGACVASVTLWPRNIRSAAGTWSGPSVATAGPRCTTSRPDRRPGRDRACRHQFPGPDRRPARPRGWTGIDVLFMNSGVGTHGPGEAVGEVSTDEFMSVMVTNALSPMRVIEALQDRVPPTGVIGVMSSGLGSVANNTNGMFDLYRGSKAAPNTYCAALRRAIRKAPGHRAEAPGWVRTDLGGPAAPLGERTGFPRSSTSDGRPGHGRAALPRPPGGHGSVVAGSPITCSSAGCQSGRRRGLDQARGQGQGDHGRRRPCPAPRPRRSRRPSSRPVRGRWRGPAPCRRTGG